MGDKKCKKTKQNIQKTNIWVSLFRDKIGNWGHIYKDVYVIILNVNIGNIHVNDL